MLNLFCQWRIAWGWLLAIGLLAGGWVKPFAAERRQQWNDGMPILVVESYSTTPNPIRSGEVFTLDVTVRNSGTKQAEDVFASVAGGSGFVGIGSPAALGKLEPQAAAAFSLRVQAPRSLAAGAYDVPLSFMYRIGESGAFEVVRTVGVQVGGGSGGASGKPQVVIETATVLAAPQAVGDQFELSLTVRNAGTRKATAVTVAPELNEYLSPAKGSGTTVVGDLDAGQSGTVRIGLVLDRPPAAGRVLQTITLDYSDSSGRTYTQPQTVGVDLAPAARQTPQLIIQDYVTQPESPTPGEPFTLTVNVANVGAGEARQILLRLGDASGLGPFAPLGASNVSFMPRLSAGETLSISRRLLADGNTRGGVYRVGVTLTYENIIGEQQTEQEVISLLVTTPPQLKIHLFEPVAEPLQIGDEFEIPIEIINVGWQTLNVSTVEVSGQGLTLTEASLYLGPLDAGTAGSLVPKAVAAESGNVTATVTVHYLDDFNRAQTLSQPLTFTVQAAVAAPQADEPPPVSFWDRLWQGILSFFGLG